MPMHKESMTATLIKTDLTGKVYWVVPMGESGGVNMDGLVVDEEGAVFCSGDFAVAKSPVRVQGSMTMQFVLRANAGTHGTDVFLLKVSNKGTALWMHTQLQCAADTAWCMILCKQQGRAPWTADTALQWLTWRCHEADMGCDKALQQLT
jgi:hypothetical protein